MAKNFAKLIFGGLHEKHAVQRGIRSRFSVVFLGPRANAELVPKFLSFI
jgi:hypothetical protein